MVCRFLHIAKRGIFDLVKMRESNLALSVEKIIGMTIILAFAFL